MALTDAHTKNAKPRSKPYKLADEKGLSLLINPNGSKWWRFRFVFDGKEQMLSLGVYPHISLRTARERRDQARTQIATGINPSKQRQADKIARADNFRAMAEEFLEQQAKSLAAITISKSRWLLSLLCPHVGDRPIGKITGPELLSALKKIEARGTLESAHRAKQKAGEVFRYCIPSGRCERDVTTDLRGALAKVVTTHRPALIRPNEVGELLRAIDGFQGQPTTLAALKLLPLTCVRPGELRQAHWTEFDLDAAM